MDRDTRRSLGILLGFLLLRALALDVTDLIDPTESRYATVAQEMVASGDWLVPKLPVGDRMEPYLGKPPLHFWLTGGAYRLFGVDEWTSRLPSFLSALSILGVVLVWGGRLFDRETGILACWILLSGSVFFFLAGASVVDVTLSAMVTASFAAFWLFFDSGPHPRARYYALAGSGLAAFAFLTKGPVALVLVGLPLAIWIVRERRLRQLRTFPWLAAPITFATIAAPWFLLNEAANPGFLRYFFWNENVARYLFAEYGDRYGTGHPHAYGTSWLMLLGAFFPWTVVMANTVWRDGLRRTAARFGSDPHLRLMLIWALATPLFFTFVRQLNVMYLLPSLPGMALLTARLLQDRERRSPGGLPLRIWATGTAGAMIAFYLIAIVVLAPHVERRRSATGILERIAKATPPGTRVAITVANAYSAWWTARSWKEQLSSPLRVVFVNSSRAGGERDLLVRADGDPEVGPAVLQPFDTVLQEGGWIWMRRTTPLPERAAGRLGPVDASGNADPRARVLEPRVRGLGPYATHSDPHRGGRAERLRGVPAGGGLAGPPSAGGARAASGRGPLARLQHDAR